MPFISMKSAHGRGMGRGFTMIEMVIALTATAVLIGAVAPFFRVNLKSYMAVRFAKDTLESARIGFNRMVSEMRRLQDTNDFNSASSTSLDFDYLRVDGTLATVRYYYNSGDGQVRRTYGGVTSRLIEGVSDFSFTYYKADGTSFTPGALTDIWRVKIKTVIGPDEAHRYTLYQDIFFKGIGKYY
jgi:prepilin-type N-terminal cleavage/methylation domain-containing protein